jgi:hypothetical protein
MLTLLAMFASVPDYHELPRRNHRTEQECNVAIQKLEGFVATYHSYVSRHEMDEGGNLTADEAAFYRGEAARFVRPDLAELREVRFKNIDPIYCHQLADYTIDQLTQRVIAPRFGPHYGLSRGPDGRWRRR